MPWKVLRRLLFIGGFALAVVLFYWLVSFFWLGPEKERESVWRTKGKWIETVRVGVLIVVIAVFLIVFRDTAMLQSLWFWAPSLIIIFSSQALVQWIYLSDKREALVSIYTIFFGIIWLTVQHLIF
ncbi:MAG: DUF4181 domain-containing protein [Alkalicoccus sp.]|nr:MAG: DUF4181 domain-containing protein [Alkalicoccus sp.]